MRLFIAKVEIASRGLVVLDGGTDDMGRVASIDVPLEEGRARACGMVDAEAEALLVPRVVVDTVGVIFMRSLETTAEHSEGVVAARKPEVQAAQEVICVASENSGVNSLHVIGFFSDDVNHTIRRIGSPNASAWSSDNFDAIDVAEGHVLHVPVDACEQLCVDATSVDENENGFGEVVLQSADAYGPRVGTEAADLNAGSKP